MKKIFTVIISALTFLSVSNANADVSTFGSVEQWLTYGGTDNNEAVDVLATGSNFIGFKANEDLGDGYSAYAKMFWRQYNEDTSGQYMFDHYIGLKAPWGKLQAGRHNSLSKQLHEDYINQFEIGNTLGQSTSFKRNNNSIIYWTPSINGLTLAYESVQDGTNGSNGQDKYEVGAEYKAGDWKTAVTYMDDKNLNDQALSIGFAKNIGNLTVNTAYEKVANNDGTPDYDAISAMGIYKAGNNAILAGTTQVDDPGIQDVTTFELQHMFSKTVKIVLLHQIKDGSTAADTKLTGVGMRMKF